jgi:hypothetical protein
MNAKLPFLLAMGLAAQTSVAAEVVSTGAKPDTPGGETKWIPDANGCKFQIPSPPPREMPDIAAQPRFTCR